MTTTTRINKLERQVEAQNKPSDSFQMVILEKKGGLLFNQDGTPWIEPNDGIKRQKIILTNYGDV